AGSARRRAPSTGDRETRPAPRPTGRRTGNDHGEPPVPLTSKQRAYLKSLAHPLKPILQIGREGVTDAVARTVTDAFNTRELLKVKVLEAAPAPARETAEDLAARIDGAELVQ